MPRLINIIKRHAIEFENRNFIELSIDEMNAIQGGGILFGWNWTTFWHGVAIGLVLEAGLTIGTYYLTKAILNKD